MEAKVDPALVVTLTVDGMDYQGWKSVEIGAGIERQARSFSLAITWRWPGSADRPFRIRQGARCEVRIGRDLVLTGYVDAAPIKYDATQITTTVSGRSLTADLVDCSVETQPGQWRNQSVASIVSALSSPYGISVVDESVDASVIADHTIEPAESIFESIDRLLSLSELFSTDDGHGRLVLARPGSAGRATDALVLGENIKEGDAAFDFSKVYSEYQCIGQKAGTDDEFGEAAAGVEATVHDSRMGRRRVHVVHPSGQMTTALAQRRVEWERDYRISRSLAVGYTVVGWRQSSGDLWRQNMIVRVRDELMGFDRDMLIVEVAYTLAESGMLTKLSVAPPEGYVPEPSHKEGRKVKKGKGGDAFEYLLPQDWEDEK